MSHVADHRVRPHESLPNSTQKTDPPLLKILVLIELEDLVLHPRPNKILREASDAVRNTRVIRVVGFINEVEGLGHVFHDKWLAEFKESDINLKIEVIFSIIVKPSEDVNVIGVWNLEASAATPWYNVLVGLIGRKELDCLAWFWFCSEEDEIGDSWRVSAVRELAHQCFCFIVEHGPEEKHMFAVLEMVEPCEMLIRF